MKKKLLISFSGGRTSAFMLWYILNVWPDRFNYEIIVVFANTGKEHTGTLKFVEECSKRFGVEIIWVEAIPVESNKGKWWKVSHKVVTFKTAAKNGGPFELMVSKLGIPSTNAPFCSDQLKRKAIESYLKSIGWKDYYKAIGIRYDEPKRLPEDNHDRLAQKINKIIYLADLCVMSKWDIIAWWAKMPFDLDIPEGMGNCDNCWKKNTKLLVNNARKHPETFNWWQRMIDKYGHINNRQGSRKLLPPFNFFRGNRSANDILKLAEEPDTQIEMMFKNEKLQGCQESCEAF